jgi:predicted RNA-binding protein YlxR (DUF448 family)/ribosomal protein L30E
MPNALKPSSTTVREDRRDPSRRCLVTGEVRPREEMLRFVRAPDGDIIADLAERLPGRGMWLQAEKDVIDRACQKNMFARSAGASVKVQENFVERVAEQLRSRCLDGIGMARRAGQLVAGYEKVCAAAGRGEVEVLVFAADGAENSRAKLRPLAKQAPIIDVFTAAELAAAIGREHVVQAAVMRGALASRLLGDVRKLTGVLGL